MRGACVSNTETHARHLHRSHDFTMATPNEHAHYITKWLIRHTHSQNIRCTHPQLNCYPDNTKQACHRRARSKMEWIYTRTKVSGRGSLELAQENRKKETVTDGHFFEHLVLAYTIELTNDLGLVR